MSVYIQQEAKRSPHTDRKYVVNRGIVEKDISQRGKEERMGPREKEKEHLGKGIVKRRKKK